MPNASFDHAKGTWILQFQPMNGGGQPRSIRVRADKIPSRDPAEQKRLATALACECERYCRLLEVVPTPAQIRHAESIRAITPEQAQAMLHAQPVPPPRAQVRDVLTLERAALEHPSSIRDSPAKRREYLSYLAMFSAHSGVTALADLTLAAVQKYLAAMISQGLAWDTRRHRLMYLRRAARMAVGHGLADVLNEIVLDHRGEPEEVEAYTLDELAHCVVAFGEKHPRARLAVALGGFLGLRPSETVRIRCGDLRLDNRLPIGIGKAADGKIREAKNKPSRRLLPVPPTLARWMRALAAGRAADEPLIYAERGHPMNPKKAAAQPSEAARRRKRFTVMGFGRWLKPKLEEKTGRALMTKALRKTFAGWATRLRLEASHVEQIMGHENTLIPSITGYHYLSERYEIAADMIAPTIEKIETAIAAALTKAGAVAVDEDDAVLIGVA